MFDFVCGVAVGAAFAPFWLKVYAFLKDRVGSYLAKK